MTSYSESLEQKIQLLSDRKEPVQLGELQFSSPFLLAPMASICNAPFRILMQELGAGGSASELISCDGIIHGNQRTMEMLRIDPIEENIGIQLFGEDADLMAKAASIAEERQPDFIDINMGCPVRKVVTKGGGSALLKDTKALGPYLKKIREAITVPLTIKIRMGWDADQINADEICKVALDSGVNMVAIHGRTRAQQYRGFAHWDYIEWLAQETSMPLIGNGDLHQAHQVRERWGNTDCDALMIARGCLRNPFIFLESYMDYNDEVVFTAGDYLEVIERYKDLVIEFFEKENIRIVQIRKLIMWFAAGFQGAAGFRGQLFEQKSLENLMNYTRTYFNGIGQQKKFIDYNQTFMTSGHG